MLKNDKEQERTIMSNNETETRFEKKKERQGICRTVCSKDSSPLSLLTSNISISNSVVQAAGVGSNQLSVPFVLQFNNFVIEYKLPKTQYIF